MTNNIFYISIFVKEISQTQTHQEATKVRRDPISRLGTETGREARSETCDVPPCSKGRHSMGKVPQMMASLGPYATGLLVEVLSPSLQKSRTQKNRSKRSPKTG